MYCLSVPIPTRCAECIVGMKNVEGLTKNGHDVTLVFPDIPEAREDASDIFAFYGIKKRFILEKVPWVPVPGRRLLAGFFAAVKAKRERVDLVYCRSLQAAFMSTLFGLPCIFENHTPVRDSGLFNEFLFKCLIRNNNLKRLVVITNALKNYYHKWYGIPDTLLKVAPDAADEAKAVKRIEFSKSDNLQVGYIGQLFPGKGTEIISALAERCPWAEFHLVGGVEQDLKYWKEKTKDLQNFHLHGFVPYAETFSFRQSFDVLLAPYLHQVVGYDRGKSGSNLSKWMSPLKLFEYMSAGKAIIASDLPVIREVLSHKETALLCNPEDLDSWIQALQNIKDSPGLKKNLEENALKEFQEKYTWPKRAEAVLEDLI